MKSHMVIFVVLGVLAILVLIAFLCIIALRELMNNACLCHHLHNDYLINTRTHTCFAMFIADCNTDIRMLCLKLPEEDREAVFNAFDETTNQMYKRVHEFVVQQMPLNSKTVYGEYSDMIKDIKSFLDMFLDKYPNLDREKFNQHFSNMYDLIKYAIDEIVRKDTTLNGIDATSRDAKM